MSLLKKIFRVAVSVLMVFPAIVFPTYAESPYTYISVKYSDKISIQSDDTFKLTYEMKGQTGDATITIAPSKIGKNLGLINLPKGKYLITDISYSGSNNKILQQGYASVSSFSASSNGGANIEIAAGSQAVSALMKKHPDAVSQEGLDTASADEKDPQEEADSGDETGTEANTETQKKKKPVTKQKEKASSDSSSSIADAAVSSISSLLPLCFIFIIGLAVIYILHKNDKI